MRQEPHYSWVDTTTTSIVYPKQNSPKHGMVKNNKPKRDLFPAKKTSKYVEPADRDPFDEDVLAKPPPKTKTIDSLSILTKDTEKLKEEFYENLERKWKTHIQESRKLLQDKSYTISYNEYIERWNRD